MFNPLSVQDDLLIGADDAVGRLPVAMGHIESANGACLGLELIKAGQGIRQAINSPASVYSLSSRLRRNLYGEVLPKLL